ncbi:MAG: hypothetical protein IJT39_03590 [Bacteroidales bacterium]|nr:hypothetical protein [Bacteroidales bacterium]
MKEIAELTQGVQRIERLLRRMEESDAVDRIEIDLLLQELRALYGVALSLPTTAQQPQPHTAAQPEPLPQVEEAPEPVVEATPAPTPVVAPVDNTPQQPRHVVAPEDAEEDPEVEAQPLMQSLEDNDTETLFDAPAAPETKVEPEPAPMPEPKPEPKPVEKVEPAIVAIPVPEEKADPATLQAAASQRQSSLFDYIRTSNQTQEAAPATLGDKIGRTGNEMRGETAQHKRVSDLRTIININDKFSFMKDLFQNNMKAYNDFILQLNSIEDRATAQRRVDEVAQLYNWDKGSLTVKTFYSIFDRKF